MDQMRSDGTSSSTTTALPPNALLSPFPLFGQLNQRRPNQRSKIQGEMKHENDRQRKPRVAVFNMRLNKIQLQ
uniref:Uncharacterized protein n=1 Tax=Cucumis melo TaxID=3656 RepID=A0A9I9EET0_CUCME